MTDVSKIEVLEMPYMPGLAQHLADVHAEAFEHPWDAEAFDMLLAQPGAMVLAAKLSNQEAASLAGFLLARFAANEGEILTIAVQLAYRRAGIGRELVTGLQSRAVKLGSSIYLEVSEPNLAARGLYREQGFAEVGRRANYYRHENKSPSDALVLRWPSAKSLQMMRFT